MRLVLKVCSLIAVCVFFIGCSGSGKRYPATGKVTVNGEPAGGVVLVFNPAGKPDTLDKKPSAITNDDGTFVVGTDKPDDGLAAGEYIVTAFWPAKPKAAAVAKGMGGEDERAGDAPDQFKGKYRDVKTSTLKVTVQSSSNQLDPISFTK